ncbi:hypothetical protein [Roseibium sp.]|uniref:hypothetical protein n=1 Tax=Roseibium sp. TaxID=1936156 RepID=UPI003299FEA7
MRFPPFEKLLRVLKNRLRRFDQLFVADKLGLEQDELRVYVNPDSSLIKAATDGLAIEPL